MSSTPTTWSVIFEHDNGGLLSEELYLAWGIIIRLGIKMGREIIMCKGNYNA